MREKSFSDRVCEGWSMLDLMDYYALTDGQYYRVIESLANIERGKK